MSAGAGVSKDSGLAGDGSAGFSAAAGVVVKAEVSLGKDFGAGFRGAFSVAEAGASFISEGFDAAEEAASWLLVEGSVTTGLGAGRVFMAAAA